MDINIYDVIVRTPITTKSQRLNRDFQQMVLEVHPKATKPMIARALKAIFNAEVERIGIITRETKAKRQARGRNKISSGKLYKRAIIKLKKGTKSEIMNLVPVVPQNIKATAEIAE